MTIGENIVFLREKAGLSQEALAEKCSVSRQSISKWETNQSFPQIDKVILMSEIFGITVDELLKVNQKYAAPPVLSPSGKYFGTDGFRGEANVGLTSMHAYKIGRFLGWYYASPLYNGEKHGKRPRIVIGKDTRRSSYMLEYAIVAGITASGADAYMLHVTTTPSVSYVTRQDEFDCGIMITASHNPFSDNGIKVINRHGEKLDDYTVSLIESYLDGDMGKLNVKSDDIPLAHKEKIGCIVDYVAGRNRYVGYLISLASHSYKNLKIGLDCANGASWMIARSVFAALGANVTMLGTEPNGLNINDGCGSTHIENLANAVREKHLDVGFAFDGDADRCIAVDENGNTVDGDAIIYLLGKRLKDRGMLKGDTVVATTMSNGGLISSLSELGISCVQTDVGDRFVYECMQKNDYALGGEHSGHIIVKKYATTGDGILTAIMITEEICDRKSTLSKLTEDMRYYPQIIENVRVADKDAVLNDPSVLALLDSIRARMLPSERIILRKSGTEPLIRIMAECEAAEDCKKYASELIELIKERGYALDR